MPSTIVILVAAAAAIGVGLVVYGIVGLKTTWGRVPLDGVWPLSPSFDTVGPMANSVEDVAVQAQCDLLLCGSFLRPALTPSTNKFCQLRKIQRCHCANIFRTKFANFTVLVS